MRKIKNLKIPIYFYDIQRKLRKKQIDTLKIFGDENSFKEHISNIISDTELSAIYENFPRDWFYFDTFLADKKALNLSLVVITLGNKIEKKFNELADDPVEKNIFDTTLKVYFSTAVKIISELINEEAKDENLTVSTPVYIHTPFEEEFENEVRKINIEPARLAEILSNMQSEKINVYVDGNTVNPKFTQIFSLEWISKKKK